MISLLPKLGDSTFILAYVVPSFLFTVILYSFFSSWAISEHFFQIVIEQSVGTLACYIGAVWLLAIVLAAFNFWIYRVLEGYLPPVSWLQNKRKKYQNKVERIRSELGQLFKKLKANLPSDRDTHSRDLLRYGALYRESIRFPSRLKDVMPTSFGNAIKCFETYPTDVYGADAVVLWPRLLPVASAAYAAAVGDARSQIDFFVNCAFLSAIISLISLFFLLYSGATSAYFSVRDLLWFVVSVFSSWSMYKGAVASVPAWGNLVKSGFDCYLPDLAKQLGFDLPKTDAQRRKFWQELSEQAEYRVKPDGTTIFKVEDWLVPPPK